MTMKPERHNVEKILSWAPSSVQCQRLITSIRKGKLFVYPTETIYGIGGIATERVREKVYAAKKRKPENPLLLIAGDTAVFNANNIFLNRQASLLAEVFWPGKLTLIVPETDTNGTVGIRISDHPFLQWVARNINLPLFSTSANISGEEYVNDPAVIYSRFAGCIDFMVDAGVLPRSEPSTVVDVSRDDRYTIIREGAVSAAAIRTVLDTQE